MRIQRNAQCPCGSGKKYKKCCLARDREQASEERRSAARGHSFTQLIGRINHWLESQHEFIGSLEDWLHHLVSAADAYELFERLDEDCGAGHEMFFALSLDRLLFEGEISVNDSRGTVRLVDLLAEREQIASLRGLGPLDDDQQHWLRGLPEAPLRIYEVQSAEPGVALLLRDLLTGRSQRILEVAASRQLEPGELIATRIVRGPGEQHRATMMWPISRSGLRSSGYERLGIATPEQDPSRSTEELAREAWIMGFVAPPPTLVDQTSGEPIVFVTHHFEVHDWPTVEQTFDSQPDWVGSRSDGWTWLLEPDAEMSSVLGRAEPSARPGNRIELSSNTKAKADRARTWFEDAAGEAVRFSITEITDPTAMWTCEETCEKETAGFRPEGAPAEKRLSELEG